MFKLYTLKQIPFPIVIAISFLLSSCTKGYLINEDEHYVQLNSHLVAGNAMRLYLGNTWHFTDTTNWYWPTFRKNAIVELYENGKFIERLENKELKWIPDQDSHYDGGYYFFNYYSKQKIKANHTYTIKVETDNKIITATTHVPQIPDLVSVDTTRYFLTNYSELESNEAVRFDITLNDPDTTNYYLLQLTEKDMSRYYRTDSNFVYSLNNQLDSIDIATLVSFTCTDPIIEDWISTDDKYTALFFKDNIFNGQQYTIQISVNDAQIKPRYYFDSIHVPVNIELYAINKDFYEYHRRYFEYIYDYDNPYRKPENLYSNINGGLGIMDGATPACKTLLFNIEE
jgi:hypothetical protein